MTTKNRRDEGELSEQQLDKVSGGQQQVVKMGTIVVEAKRPKPAAQAQPQQVVKMETIVVTSQREKHDIAGAKLAQREVANKKD